MSTHQSTKWPTLNSTSEPTNSATFDKTIEAADGTADAPAVKSTFKATDITAVGETQYQTLGSSLQPPFTIANLATQSDAIDATHIFAKLAAVV